MHRVAQRSHQHGRRRDHQHQAQHREQRRGEPMAATDPAGDGICSGYSVTARISDQIIRPMNGESAR